MPNPTTQPSQAAREAAIPFAGGDYTKKDGYSDGYWIKCGDYDYHPLVQAFARFERDTEKRVRESVAGENVEHLRHVIDRDRYVAAACLGAIEKVLHSRSWLREAGRGSYAYDDERYQQEFGLAFDEITAALQPLRHLAKDKSDCTTDESKVKAAREAGAEKFEAISGECTCEQMRSEGYREVCPYCIATKDWSREPTPIERTPLERTTDAG
jgi:hypothetical protein